MDAAQRFDSSPPICLNFKSCRIPFHQESDCLSQRVLTHTHLQWRQSGNNRTSPGEVMAANGRVGWVL